MFLCLVILATGCARTVTTTRSPVRPFVFGQDTFAYANELMWHYEIDPVSGKMTHSPEKPKPDYTHHCFVVARSARQFFDNARFDPSAPIADQQTYRAAIRKVIHVNPRHALSEPVIIPGYSNLFAFSQAQEKLLKRECGGAWQSYFQRGHWRIIFPLKPSHQQQMAAQLSSRVQAGLLPLIHLVRFPQLTINHAMLLFDSRETTNGYEFEAYDPNSPSRPVTLSFDGISGRFQMPAARYFPGGRVDIYEIYHAWDY